MDDEELMQQIDNIFEYFHLNSIDVEKAVSIMASSMLTIFKNNKLTYEEVHNQLLRLSLLYHRNENK